MLILSQMLTSIDIKVAKNGLIILYLMFADDCLVFCKINQTVAQQVRKNQDNYCKDFGQLVNYVNL